MRGLSASRMLLDRPVPPHPDRKGDPTSPRKRGEVREPALIPIHPDDAAFFDRERQPAVLQRKRRLAEQFAAPAMQRCDVGLIISSETCARGGRQQTMRTDCATSSGCRIRARCSGVTGVGRCSRIGVSTSPG